MICYAGRTCLEMEVDSLYKVFLNKTFRINFSSLLNMVVKEMKQHTLWDMEEYK